MAETQAPTHAMQSLGGAVVEFLRQAWDIWLDGGWAMVGIAFISLVLFGVGVHLYLLLLRKGFAWVGEDTWRRWIERPEERRGPIGELLDRAGDARTIEEAARAFGELQAAECAALERDLRVLRVCVTAAPLVGLLGTVTGMLTTFAALGAGSGGDKTMVLVSAGISEALITTETGLVVALPGLFLQYLLSRRIERYKAFLAHLQTVSTQSIHRRLRQVQQRAAQREALGQVARRLYRGLVRKSAEARP